MELLATQTAILSPLTSKLASSRVIWMEERELAFNYICKHIFKACTLCIPLPEDMYSIVKDTSGLGIGGVLQVWRSDQWAFYSHQTRGAEQRYSATELETLALVDTAKHFAYYLYGKSFPVQAFTSAAGIRSSQPQTTSRCDEVATLATHHGVSAQKRKWTCRCPFQGRTSKNGVPHHRDECLSSLGGYWGTPLMKAPVWETGIGSTGAKQ